MPFKPELLGISFAGPDFAAFISIFFDNLATLVGVSAEMYFGCFYACFDAPAGDPLECQDRVSTWVYKRFVPAVGLMLLLGNGYYTFQAIRMAKKYQRPYTAQPYGINTAAAFPFVFGIILPIMNGSLDKDQTWTGVKRVDTAFQVCLMANFVTGLINLALCIPGEHMLRFFPTAAALTPLAGIGFVWLAFNQLVKCFAAPAIGLLPIYLMVLMYYTNFVPAIKGFRIPDGLVIAGAGTLIAWIAAWTGGTPAVHPERVSEAFQDATGSFISFAFEDIGKGFEHFADVIGTVLPFALAASFEGLMCLVSANKAGDPYNVRESMIVDSLGTLTGACFGSPVGTVIYVGHPVHKKIGARTGYSLFNGMAYCILCFSGAFKAFAEIFPSTAVGPVIAFFGVAMCEEAIKYTPTRHHFAVLIGLLFAIADLAFGAPPSNGPKYGGDNEYKGYQGLAPDATFGKFAMHEGAPLIAMLWVGFCCYMADRRFLEAAAWQGLLVIFAGCGFIHQTRGWPDEASKEFSEGMYAGLGEDGVVGKGYAANSPMMFMLGYLQMFLCSLFAAALQKAFPDSFKGAVEAEQQENLFATWWDKAAAPLVKEIETTPEREIIEKDLESVGMKLSERVPDEISDHEERDALESCDEIKQNGNNVTV